MSAPNLDRLSALAGLALGYWDAGGTWREPSAAARAATLSALGWDVDSDQAIDDAIAKLETQSWQRTVPPVHVTREDQGSLLPIVVRPGTVEAWRLDLEGGEVVIGSTADAPAIETRTMADELLERRELTLPPMPSGYHRLSIGAGETLVISHPFRCFVPEAIADGRVWGVSVQLYGLRSERNWGVGDYTDLAILGRVAAVAGADILGVNPLHARSSARPENCSPYSPVSRLALDPLAIDPEALPEFVRSEAVRAQVRDPAFQEQLAVLRALPMVDYPAVTAIKMPILRLLHAVLAGGDAARRAAFDRYKSACTEDIVRYAQFEALRFHHDAILGRRGWWDWPIEPPPNASVLEAEVDFQLWLQFAAEEQLDAANQAMHDAGMRIGIYRDLAVGAARDSAEAWAAPALASALSVGAPPDALSVRGQNWGIPAPDPRAIEAAGYQPFAALLRANMRAAGALRIDHAMALLRLFVIPPSQEGSSGTYLSYPFEAMTGVLALESNRQRCVIIGEDLGTVPEGFREAIAVRALHSYKVLYFERYDDGAFRASVDYPSLSLATASTHDLPPLAGLWTGRDIEIGAAIGIVEDRAAAERDRERERQRFRTLFEWQNVMPPRLDDPADVIDAMHRLIARSASSIAMVQIDDILGETDPVNIPGTTSEYPNWCRKAALSINDPDFAARFARAASIFVAERPKTD